MADFGFIVGIVGNVISILVFASPISTFWRILKVKSTQNYEGIPYITTLLSTSLWTYYGLLKPGGLLVVTVNGAGSVMQAVYVTLFLIYAPKNTRAKMAKLVGMLNVGLLGVIILVTFLATHGSVRLLVIGCMCAALTVGMYAAPLAAMRLVVQTRSVEFMPFSLSFFLFLNGGVWTAYAVLVRDFFIGIPNGIGFIMGMAQLILYAVYRRKTPAPKDADFEKEMTLTGIAGDVEMSSKMKVFSKGSSLPKPSVSRQQSLTKIVKTLSLPPYESSKWNVNEYIEKQLPI